jgi:hypothetical protein
MEQLNYPTQVCPLCQRQVAYQKLFTSPTESTEVRVCGCAAPTA